MKRTFLAVLLSLLVAPFASATVLDFGTGNSGSGGLVVVYGGGHVAGYAINIDSLTVNPGNTVYDVDGDHECAAGDGGFCGGLYFDTDEGEIYIYGSVPSLGVDPTYLLVGTISSFEFTPFGSASSFFSLGLDLKDADLLDALGIDPATEFTYFGYTLSGPLPADSIFAGECAELGVTCYEATSTDIFNSPVPEPGTLILLGTGLVGVARAARRRKV